jgi:pyrroline-5-carboxylate reductase
MDGAIKEQHLKNIVFCEQLFASMGLTAKLNQEGLFHIGTALSSSGLAYLFSVMDALADGAVEGGMGRGQALALISQLFIGAGKLSQVKHPMLLKDQVASPAGVTIRGLRTLEKNQMRSAFIEALCEATQKSKEMDQ